MSSCFAATSSLDIGGEKNIIESVAKESQTQCEDNGSQCSSGGDKRMRQELEEQIRQELVELCVQQMLRASAMTNAMSKEHTKLTTKALESLMAEVDTTAANLAKTVTDNLPIQRDFTPAVAGVDELSYKILTFHV